MCISEANVKSKYFCGSPNDFPGYNLELNAQYNLIGTSRNCILIRDTIKYNRRTDLEDTLNCDIWLQVALGNKKESLICGSYRQWSLFKEMGVTNS